MRYLVVNLGQERQTDDVQFLKRKLKECIQEMERNPSQENSAKCDEIQELLTKAIKKIQKREGVQNPGSMPQVSMQPKAFQRDQYSWNSQAAMQPKAFQRNQYSWNNQAVDRYPGSVQSNPPETAQCPPGQFWDGRQCRGSVSTSYGGMMPYAATPSSSMPYAATPSTYMPYTSMTGRGIPARPIGIMSLSAQRFARS